MKSFTMLKPELEEQNFGSPFDPVLSGVAHGLARLFPPIETVRLTEGEEESPGQNDAETECMED